MDPKQDVLVRDALISTKNLVVRGKLSDTQIEILKHYDIFVDQNPEHCVLYYVGPTLASDGKILFSPRIYGDIGRNRRVLSNYLDCGRSIQCFLDICIKRKHPLNSSPFINDWRTLIKDSFVNGILYKKGIIFPLFKEPNGIILNIDSDQATSEEIIFWYKRHYPKLWKGI